MPKLSSFFEETAVAAGLSAEEELPSTLFALTLTSVNLTDDRTDDGNVIAPVNPSGSNQQTDGDDAQLAVSNSISPSSSSTSDADYDNNDREAHIFVDDPALWPKLLTDREHCSMAKMGPIQVKDKDFPQNEKGHRFTKAKY